MARTGSRQQLGRPGRGVWRAGLHSPPPPSTRGHTGQDAAHLLGIILHLQAVTSFFAFSLLKDTETTGWNRWTQGWPEAGAPPPHVAPPPPEGATQTGDLGAPLAAGCSQDPREVSLAKAPTGCGRRAREPGASWTGVGTALGQHGQLAWGGPRGHGGSRAGAEGGQAGRGVQAGPRSVELGCSDGPTRSCAAIPCPPPWPRTDWSHPGNPRVPPSQGNRQNTLGFIY